MTENVLPQVGGIVALGVGAQWLAWRLRVPAILLLLVCGFAAGPGLELVGRPRFLDPAGLFGPLLTPLVSLCVGIVLFEGGLTLRLAELTQAGAVIRNLVTIGAAVTWCVATVAARFVLGLPWPLALLLGAILVVTGPTVIGPLLRHVRPRGPAGAILKWEGIVIDPIGAMWAVLVFEAIPAGKLDAAATTLLLGALKTSLVGTGIGLAGAGLLVVVLKRLWAPDYLQNPVTLMLVVVAFVSANLLQHEAGLFAVTAMGIALANQRAVVIRHIVEFKENLTVLLVSGLFIVLGAALTAGQVRAAGWGAVGFAGVLILVARPLSVFASTIASTLTVREKLFLCCMAPRGIVAAAVTSVFALRLGGEEGADRLVPATFTVIVGTVVVYGLLARPAARALGLAAAAKGFLVAGANPVARAVAKALQDQGVAVVLVDTSAEQIRAARLAGLNVFYGSVLSEAVAERNESGALGRLLALTPNGEVNALAALQYGRVFGRDEVYALAAARAGSERKQQVHPELRGRTPFAEGATYDALLGRIGRGAAVRRTAITDAFSYADYLRQHGGAAIPLFVVGAGGDGDVRVVTPADAPPRAGEAVVALVGGVD